MFCVERRRRACTVSAAEGKPPGGPSQLESVPLVAPQALAWWQQVASGTSPGVAPGVCAFLSPTSSQDRAKPVEMGIGTFVAEFQGIILCRNNSAEAVNPNRNDGVRRGHAPVQASTSIEAYCVNVKQCDRLICDFVSAFYTQVGLESIV